MRRPANTLFLGLGFCLSVSGATAAIPRLASAQTAAAAGRERAVLLKSGATYRGEATEFAPGDHITLKLASGEEKRFEFRIIKEYSDPLGPQEPGGSDGGMVSGMVPERMVVLPDGAIYRGIVLEYEPGDHIALRMHDGTIKRYAWKDIKQAMAPVSQKDPTVAIPIAAERQVWTRSGAKKKGVLLEYVPDDHVTLRLLAKGDANGAVERFAWADIDKVTDVTLPPKVVAPGTPGAIEVAPDDGTQGEHPTKVKVTLKSDNPEATLEVLDAEGEDALTRAFRTPEASAGTSESTSGSSATASTGDSAGSAPATESTPHGEWRHICVAPCDQVVEVSRKYRIGGDGIVPSEAFKLKTTSDGHVLLAAKTAGSARRSAGFALIALGVLGVGGGVGMIAAAEATKNSADATASRTLALRAGGGAALGAGLIMLPAGIALVVLAKTHVRLESGVQLARTPLYLSLSGLHF